MNTMFEGRASDSPYIEMIWRGRTGPNYTPVCPADEHWNLLFSKYQDAVKVCVEGPLTKALPKTQPEGVEWLVIRFTLGTFMPHLPVGQFMDGDAAFLPEASNKSFWLKSSTWELPDFDNVETFVERLAHHQLLVTDPIVKGVIQNQQPDTSSRTVRRRFLTATGITPKVVQQIERARQAMTLLEQGVPILDAVYQLGYADQPHMTRSLKRFIGQTPAQISRP